MDSIGVVTLLLTEREANFFWVLYERKRNPGIKSEDKLDGVSNGNKRTEETAKELEPD
jgi:hypothetical protein